MDKLIITAAICGAEATQADNPNLPLTADELATAARGAEDAGAAIIHLHVRDERGEPSQERRYFDAAFAAIAAAGVRAIVQPSTGGAAGMSAAERVQPVDANPEMASLDCGTLNFGETIFVNDLPLMREFALRMRERGVTPELECFEPGHIANALRLRDEGLLPDHLHFNIVLGVPGALPATPDNLLFMVGRLPAGASWTATGIGRHQTTIALLSIASGGHVRVGFEDSVYYSRGVLADSNAQQVARIARIAHEYGRPLATPDDARSLLSIPKRSAA
jgi:3-keto-5-aminohexanoate cleavage enzyme